MSVDAAVALTEIEKLKERIDAIEQRIGLGKYSPHGELNRRQIQTKHGERVEARQKEKERPFGRC